MSRSLHASMIFAVALLLITCGVVVGVFLYHNDQWVIVHVPGLSWTWDDPFPTLEYEARLWLVILTAFIAGFLLSGLLLLPSRIRRAVERGRERRHIRGLEGELDDLRNLPVNSPAPLEDIAEEGEGILGPAAAAEEEERALLAAALQEPLKRPGR